MQYLLPNIEKVNGDGAMPFRTWDGNLAVTVPCGDWRPATRLEAVLLFQPWRLIIVRDAED